MSALSSKLPILLLLSMVSLWHHHGLDVSVDTFFIELFMTYLLRPIIYCLFIVIGMTTLGDKDQLKPLSEFGNKVRFSTFPPPFPSNDSFN